MCVHASRARDGARERAGVLCTILLGVHLMLCFSHNLTSLRDFTDYMCATIVVRWFVKFDNCVAYVYRFDEIVTSPGTE